MLPHTLGGYTLDPNDSLPLGLYSIHQTTAQEMVAILAWGLLLSQYG